jgi:hypothetical protein
MQVFACNKQITTAGDDIADGNAAADALAQPGRAPGSATPTPA